MKKRTNATNEKATGGQPSGFKKCATNRGNFTAMDAAQLQLDLDGQHTANRPAARQDGPCLTRKPLRDKKPGTKMASILALFLLGRNMNRFEAENHHDHCLHSTVSTLQNGYGIIIARKSETVPCLRGRSTVRCMRYWLDTSPSNITAARALLSMLERAAS